MAQTASPVDINPGETVTYAAGGSGEFLTVTSDGSANRGILIFNDTSSYTGGLIISGAEVRLARTGAATTIPGTITVNENSVLRFMQSDPVGYYTTPTSTIYISGGTVTTSDNADYHVTLNNLEFSGGTLTSSGAGNSSSKANYVIDGSIAAISGNSQITAAAIQFRKRSTNNPTQECDGGPIHVADGASLLITSNMTHFGGKGSGTGDTDADIAIIKTGGGVLTLSGDCTSLPVTVNEGSVVRTGGVASDVLTLNAGTAYDLQGGSHSAGITVMDGATLTTRTGELTSGGTVRLAGGTVEVKTAGMALGRPITLDAATDSTIAIDPGLTVTLTGLISGDGALTVTSGGSETRGILTTNQQNTFKGGLTIDGAEVQLNRSGEQTTIPTSITVLEDSVLRFMRSDAVGYNATGTEEIKILGGTVTTTNSGTFHVTLGDLTFQNGALNFEATTDGQDYIVDGIIHVLPDDGGAGSFINSANLRFRTSNATARRAAGDSLGGTVKVDAGGTLTIASAIAGGGGTPSVKKQGLGELILTGNNALPVSVEQGTITRTAGTESNNDIKIGTVAGQEAVYTLGGTGVINNTSLTLLVGYTGTGTLNVNDGVNLTAGTLNIGDKAGSTGYANVTGSGSVITAGTLNIGAIGAGTMIVGDNNTLTATNLTVGATGTSTGTLEIGEGVTVTPTTLIIGKDAGSDGKMILGAGSTLTTGNVLTVGDFGKGELTVNGGTLNVKEISVGKGDNTDTGRTGDGTLNLNNVTVTFDTNLSGGGRGYFFVGQYGKGTVVQDGGSVTMLATSNNRVVFIADQAGAGSSYTLKGDGTLTATGIVVGQRAAGGFTQESGTITLSSHLYVGGDGSGSGTGTYTMSDGSIITPLLEVGRGSTFTMDDGEIFGSVSGGDKVAVTNLNVYTASGFTMHGGDASAISINVSGSSAFNLSGGTVAVGQFYVGKTGGTAENPNVLNISGGEIVNIAGQTSYFRVGENGVGAVNQTGGSLTLTSSGNTHSIYIADQSGGAGSSYTISDTDGPASISARLLVVGQRGAGSFTHNGGTVTVEQVYVGYDPGGTSAGIGTYTLSGGTLNTPTVTVRDNGSQFIMNGGTLQMRTFNTSLTNDGGVLDLTAFHDVTIDGGYVQTGDGTLRVGVELAADGTVADMDSLTANSFTLEDGILDLIFSGNFDWATAGVGDVEFSILGAISPNGSFSSVTSSNITLADGLMWQYDSGIVSLGLAPMNDSGGVPEPATWVMLLLGLAGLAVWRRRKN